MEAKQTKRIREQRPKDALAFIKFINKEYAQLVEWNDVVQAVADLSQGLALTNEAKARLYYRLGKILHSLPKEQKRNILNIFNIHKIPLRMFNVLAEKFATEDEVVDFLRFECDNRLTDLFKKLSNRNQPNKTLANTFNNIARKVIGAYYSLKEHDKIIITENIEKLAKWFPLKTQIDDRSFLRYSRCACCGRDENVYPLTLQKYPNNPALVYPVCQECLDIEAPIDYKILAEIWGLYAYNIEAVFNKIHYGEDISNY